MTAPETVTRVLRLSLGKKAWDALRLAVFERDGWRCAGRMLDPENHTVCADKWGYPFVTLPYRNLDRVASYLTLDHVPDPGGTKGRKAADLESRLVAACWGAHLGTGPQHGFIWSTSRTGRDLVRQYLAGLYPEEWPTIATEPQGAPI